MSHIKHFYMMKKIKMKGQFTRKQYCNTHLYLHRSHRSQKPHRRGEDPLWGRGETFPHTPPVKKKNHIYT